MIPVWKFLLERVKSEKTNEGIRRNFVIHGTTIAAAAPIPSSESSFEGKESGIESSTKDQAAPKERPKTPKSDREGLKREGTVVKTPARERRGKVRSLAKDVLPERELREAERALPSSEGPEGSREMAMRERDVAMGEVGRLRVTVERLVKEIKSRMVDVSKEESERQRVWDDRANSRYFRYSFSFSSVVAKFPLNPASQPASHTQTFLCAACFNHRMLIYIFEHCDVR